MTSTRKNMAYYLGGLVWMILSSNYLFAEGSSSRGGGFVDFNGNKILKAAVAELPPYLARVQPPMFKKFPERKAIVERAVNTIQIRSGEVRYRKGQRLVMDYDPGHMNVTVLRPFFEGFQTTALSSQSIYSAQQLILHEIAHLWGDDDTEADQFATETLYDVSIIGQVLVVERIFPFDLEKCISHFHYEPGRPGEGWCQVYIGPSKRSDFVVHGDYFDLSPKISAADVGGDSDHCYDGPRSLDPQPMPGPIEENPVVRLTTTVDGYRIEARQIPYCRGPEVLRRAFAGYNISEVKATVHTDR